MGHEGAALADALYFAPADHAEVLAHIRRYDPDYSSTGTALQVDREGIRAPGSELLRAQGDFLFANANSCTPAVETTQLWYDANWAINGAGAFTPVSQATVQEQQELLHRAYQANGGALSFEEWLAEGMPENDRVFNVSRQENPIWRGLTNFRSGIRTSGSGRNKRYYEGDNTHNDIEVYDRRGNHLGSMNPVTGEMYKPAVPGRTIDI